jgi:hypothetical protein
MFLGALLAKLSNDIVANANNVSFAPDMFVKAPVFRSFSAAGALVATGHLYEAFVFSSNG